MPARVPHGSADWFGLRERLRYYPPILGYHRVGVIRADHVPTVTLDAFREQLAIIKRLGCAVLSLDEMLDAYEAAGRWPRGATAITFDDGYEETATLAWPVLQDFGFHATVFVTPAEVGLKGFLTWEQVQTIARQGMGIGSHTMNHSYLPLVPDSSLENELVESKAVLENRIGQPIRYLSYPVGGFTQQAQSVARAAGYRAAFTTNRLSFVSGVDPFALRRVKVTERDRNPLIFHAKLSGRYDLFRQLRKPA